MTVVTSRSLALALWEIQSPTLLWLISIGPRLPIWTLFSKVPRPDPPPLRARSWAVARLPTARWRARTGLSGRRGTTLGARPWSASVVVRARRSDIALDGRPYTAATAAVHPPPAMPRAAAVHPPPAMPRAAAVHPPPALPRAAH